MKTGGPFNDTRPGEDDVMRQREIDELEREIFRLRRRASEEWDAGNMLEAERLDFEAERLETYLPPRGPLELKSAR